ncbi:class D beta-lactamase [Microvirga pudoricolor]|uniref:class D beta-lactamase n=1 Tax=Microvirga pudoricolor TaxID=2778729 RepID=UPI00195013CC|nr:class D beta-lactamase [Microvirga pudoricolor]MBM6595024.1 class D beta-lactamase [Microvirga pudoricolor]
MRYPRTLFLAASFLAASPALAQTCTILSDAETGRILVQQGPCDTRNSPASTFKVPLAVMGFDFGILQNSQVPAWPYRAEYRAWNDAWKRAIDPQAWLRDSVVWYSQELTRRLGMERFQRYVDAFGYGNRDLSGDPGRNNGLTHAWLGSSLTISPLEEVAFMRRLVRDELPVSKDAQAKTRAAMPEFSTSDGWRVRGKTGSGFGRGSGGKPDRTKPFGWFVGWAEKEGRTVVFARLIKSDVRVKDYLGPRTRDGLLEDWPALVPAR